MTKEGEIMIQILLLLLMLGVFLGGMYLLRTALFNLSSDKLKYWLATLTDSPWKGLLLGFAVTAVLQSSSAVSIIVIGLVAGQLIRFSQAIGIILGANIGTTLTTEIITLDIDSMILPIGILGVLLFFINRKSTRSIGLVLIGLAAIFGAMLGIEQLAAPLTEMLFIEQLFNNLDNNRFYAVLVGILVCAIIQSSTTTTAITMGFIAAGALNLDTAIAIVLGANIGTCVDAWFASIGSGKEAKLTAWSHIWINIIGVIIFFPLIGVLANIGIMLTDRPEVQIAHISVIFNVLSSLMILPFTNRFATLITKVHDRSSA